MSTRRAATQASVWPPSNLSNPVAGLALVLRLRGELDHPIHQFGAVGRRDGQHPEQNVAGLAPVLRRRVELDQPAHQPRRTAGGWIV